MKILIDMNLSRSWVTVFRQHGFHAEHWSSVGDPCAADRTIMDWARVNGYVVFTHDLDFGTLLALTHAAGPSVIQVRTQDVMPDRWGDKMVRVLQANAEALDSGALITVDEDKNRVRILPF